MENGQYQRALYDFSAAIRFQETEAEYYSKRCVLLAWLTNIPPQGSRGNCLLQLNQIKEALEEFEKAIELEPTDGFSYLNRALVYARLEDYHVSYEAIKW